MSVRVSDHAVLRFLERARGVDVEAVREHIRALCSPAAALGAVSLRAEGVRFAITKQGVVSTVLPDMAGPNRTMRDRLREARA